MHMECAGLDRVPRGKWFCPEHAALAKPGKARPASAKSSPAEESSLEPNNSAQAPPAGGNAAAKAASKNGAGGKTGKRKAEALDDEPEADAGKKGGGKSSKAKAQGAKAAAGLSEQQEISNAGKSKGSADPAQGNAPKQGGGKAGKSKEGAGSGAEGSATMDDGRKVSSKSSLPAQTAPKASSKAKGPSGAGSKAGKARQDTPSTAAQPSTKKRASRDFSDDAPVNGSAKAKQKGKELLKKPSLDQGKPVITQHNVNSLLEGLVRAMLCSRDGMK